MSEMKREDLPAHDHPVPQHVVDQMKRHEMYIDQLQGESARMFGNIEASLEYMKGQNAEINSGWRELSRRIDEQDKKLDRYNNLRERVDIIEQTHDRLSKDFIPREEFNGAVNSLREQIKSGFGNLKWVLGFILLAFGGLASTILLGM